MLAEIMDWHDIAEAIRPIFERVAEIGRTLLHSVDVSVVRRSLEDLLQSFADLSPRIASCAPVKYAHERIMQLLSFQGVIKDLCSDALRDRHWAVLWH